MSPRLTVTLFALALWLPFMGRPLFVDDHAHFQQAVERGRHPGRPYDEQGLGWRKGASPGEANPPLYFYLVGAVTRVAGEAPWISKLALLPLHLLGLWGFFGLARRWTRHPLWASVLWLTTPHHWVTANSLLLDALIAPIFLAGLRLWVDGWDVGQRRRLIGGALLLGLAPLVKYTAVLAWPVALGAAWVMGTHRRSLRWLWLMIALVPIAAWMAWSGHIYGTTHLSAVAAESVVRFDGDRLSTLLIFFVAATPVVIAGLAAFLRAGKNCDRVDASLALWIVVGLAGLLWARGWVCARYFVVVGPAAVLWSVRRMENAGWADRRAVRVATAAVLTLIGGTMAAADYFQARVDVRAARDLESARARIAPDAAGRYPDALLSGLSVYLPADHWTPIAPHERPRDGDVIALSVRQLPSIFRPNIDGYEPAAAFPYSSPLPLRLQDGPTGAGWYGSIWGPKPFSFTRAPSEIYLLLTPRTTRSAPTVPSKT
jgi:hypothetical protein